MLVNKLKYYRFIIVFLTCFLTGLIPNLSLAFTLGDIRLNSALNEPLSANIELLELDGLDESEILVALGSEADFDRVGVEPLPLLNELEFEVEVLSNSEGLVRITSADAIVEPYLNFVLNVRWPSGRVIREYTVLLDLPTFSANPTPAPAPTPARTTPAPPPQVEPVPQQVVEVAEPTPVATAPEIDETPDAEPSAETVVIQSGDSLWNIALATRPGNDVSVQQMMLAIQRANTNSDAFIGNNINGIRAGRVLRIPSRQEINAINQEQAVTQVAVQNQQFSNSAQPLAVNNSQGSSNNSRDELSIVNNADDEAENEEIADLNATIAILENELAFSEENLDRALLENAELNSRLNDLEEEIAILENIIAIEGQRMAELQEALADQDNTATSDVFAVVPPQNPAPAPGSTSPEPAPAPATGIIGQVSNLLSSTLGMVAALVVLLALVVGFLIARNRSASKEEDDFDSILAEEEETGFSANAAEDAGMEESLFTEEVADEIAEDIDEQESFDQAEITESEENMQLDDSEQDIQQELADEEDVFADEEDVFADNDEKESGKAGFLAGLLAKFSRKKDKVSEEEDFFDEDDEIDEEPDSAEADPATEFGAAESTQYDEDIEEVSEELVLDDEFENFLQDIELEDEDKEEESSKVVAEEDEEELVSESAEIEQADEEFDIQLDEIEELESVEDLSFDDEGENVDESPDKIESGATEENTEEENTEESNEEESIDFTEEPASDEPALEDETEDDTKIEAEPAEVFEFNLDDSPELNTDDIEGDSTESKESDDIESLTFEVSDDESEADNASENASDNNKEEEIETFDFGEISFDAEDENIETAEADNPESSEGNESIEIADVETDAEDIVFDLDDSNSEGAIEFTDTGEEIENFEENNETTSSLGNLGLDDAVAFDESDEDELEVITDQDEVSTKLDLAVAYQAMDDMDGAKEILDEVIAEGNEAQIAEAKKLLNEWGGS